MMRTLRPVEGRVAAGAAVAALFLAPAIVAATQDCWLLMLIFGGMTIAVMLVAFAPLIPGLRRLVAARRRRDKLDKLWREGYRLGVGPMGPPGHEFETFVQPYVDWMQRTAAWIDKHISPAEAERFKAPSIAEAKLRTHPGTSPPDHSEFVRDLPRQLKRLERLRREQERKLP